MRTTLSQRLQTLQIRLLTPVFLRLKERLRNLGADPGQTPEQQTAFRLAYRATEELNDLPFARAQLNQLYALPGSENIQEELVRLDLHLRRREHVRAEARKQGSGQ